MAQPDIPKIISEEALIEAFLKGIDNFNGLYKLQSSKNIISSNLGNLFLQKNQSVHTNDITSIEVEKANNIKAALIRMRDHDSADRAALKDFFKNFGNTLLKLSNNEEDNNKRRYITSHYSFIALAIFHNASIATSPYNDYLNMENLLKCYLTPDTLQPKITGGLFRVVGISLNKFSDPNYKYLSDSSDFDFRFIARISDTDKLWAFLCEEPQFKNKIKVLLGNEKYEYYIDLNKKIERYIQNKDILDNHLNLVVGKDASEAIKTSFKNITDTFKIKHLICEAIIAYQAKYKEKTDSPTTGSGAIGITKKQAQTFAFGSFETHIRDEITSLMGGSNPTGSLQMLQSVFPPGVITKMAAGLIGELLAIATASKGYGFINRHGVTGQTRAVLLKFYIEMLTTYLSNSYDYTFSLTNEGDIISYCNNIASIKEIFIESYKNAALLLPNKKQNGSLYYYLEMYANPSKNYEGVAPSKATMEAWNQTKLKTHYKDN
ncbi:hypothetical protein IB642_04600 [Allofrancisella guangzhouensis]|uniref:Uncharacterized protein n=1 Tax=Allofrancisella guangzhouensis TaxID=594679 RepID=A0A0A8E308_9GAMM|nr:hypothetical protein [Allofrancisella guangzhouensis]AJC48354.1 hypothetical protein SD28_01095 [Allofrancisella guangzhouensis]MBK2026553.1 hypothetical protein [Allofrancisella guangzhouensis]MBK2044297.1 hypothetical protein [Allofrancisella guangzhouensis]MBK2045540.1 hypothetical protein [Allofrancisella guangzhouensis]